MGCLTAQQGGLKQRNPRLLAEPEHSQTPACRQHRSKIKVLPACFLFVNASSLGVFKTIKVAPTHN